MSFVDLHCHLLPAIDDGAKSEADALAMAKALVALGYDTVAPSPHAKPEYPPATTCAAARGALEARLAAEGVPLALRSNAENVLTPELLALPKEALRPIGDGPFLLAEAPYFALLPQLGELLFRLALKGVKVVIAHPERCLEFQRPGRAAEAVRSGALLQLDLGALTERYGPVAKRLARQFLDDGLYAIAASDLHGPHDAERWVGASIRELQRRAGDVAARRLLDDHPRRLLAGLPLEAP